MIDGTQILLLNNVRRQKERMRQMRQADVN